MIFWIVIGLALVVAAPFAFESWRKVPAMPPDAAGERLRLSQGTTYVEWIGPARGPVVVAVHGLTTPSPVWRRLAERLGRAGYRVLVYDLYGRGLSGNAPGDQDPEFFLRQLRDVLDHHGLDEDVTLMGYSMGGAIVTAFAAAHPERIKRLILLAPVGLGHRIGGFLPFCARLPLVGDWLWLAVGPLGAALARSGASLPRPTVAACIGAAEGALPHGKLPFLGECRGGAVGHRELH